MKKKIFFIFQMEWEINFKSFQYKKVGNKIYFKDNLKEKIVKELDLKFSGTMVFDWKDSSDKTFKTLESLEIGYITDRTNPILLDFDLMTLNPINDVQVKVIEDMNLGVVFAGERLSTKNLQIVFYFCFRYNILCFLRDKGKK